MAFPCSIIKGVEIYASNRGFFTCFFRCFKKKGVNFAQMGWSVSRSNRLQWEFWLMNLLRGGDSLHFFWFLVNQRSSTYIIHPKLPIYIFRIIIATYIQDFQFIGWMVSVFCFWEDMLMMMMMMMTMTTITIPNEIHTLESSTIDHFHTSLISLYVFVYPCIPSGSFLTPIGHHQPAVRSPSWGIRITAEVETNDQTIFTLW